MRLCAGWVNENEKKGREREVKKKQIGESWDGVLKEMF